MARIAPLAPPYDPDVAAQLARMMPPAVGPDCGSDQVRSLTTGDADDPCWTEPRDRTLIRVVDALFDRRDLDDDLWQQLGRHLDEPEILDLLLLCGWYQAISLVGRVTRLPNEPGAPTFASVDVVGPGGDDV